MLPIRKEVFLLKWR